MESLGNEITVSVALITYCHEKYIRKAIESILMQRTNFQYEIIIGDDCSNDNTRQILMEYKEKNSDKVSLIMHDKNIGATKNIYDIFKKCRGKYITLLEGDDYWTDPQKLQKQVDFLETNTEYIGIAHTFNLVDGNGNFIRKYTEGNSSEKSVTIKSFLKGDFFRVTTTVFKNVFLESNDKYDVLYKANRLVGDFTLSVILLDLGDIYVLDNCMSVYRVVINEGAKNYNSIKSPLDNYNDFIYLIKFVSKHYKNKYDFSHDYIQRSYNAFIYSVNHKKLKEFNMIFKTIPKLSKLKCILYIPLRISQLLIRRIINFN